MIFESMKNIAAQEYVPKETAEKGFYLPSFKGEIISVLEGKNIPVWAKEDADIAGFIRDGKGGFIACTSYGDDYLDEFKPEYYRGYIYFDGNDYHIKRWKIRYLQGAPFRATGYDSEEACFMSKAQYEEHPELSKEQFLLVRSEINQDR